MTDRTRIAAIGAAGWAGRQVPMVGLRSLIRVGSFLGHLHAPQIKSALTIVLASQQPAVAARADRDVRRFCGGAV
jgi:hypothetical protein